MIKYVLDQNKITEILATARLAGEEILRIYESSDFGIETKQDNSPLTKADKVAHEVIQKYLLTTGVPILSEEGANVPYLERSQWSQYWLVDPLDGTKEFIKRNGEFTVNIALIEDNVPVFGIVFAPVLDKMYYGGSALGFSELAVKEQPSIRLSVNLDSSLTSLFEKESVKIVASRSHQNKDTIHFLKKFKNPEIVAMGSSLKFMVLAEAKADIYPRYAPCMEWDTAAAQAILSTSGYNIYQINKKDGLLSKPLRYNKQNLLNPSFIAF